MSFTDSRLADQTRTYERESSVVFLKTREAFGGLSNMAGGFPLYVNGFQIRTSEALYQVCRFPQLPEVQRVIIEQKSPMTAKMKSKPHRKNSRADWEQVRVKIMRWCVRVKLAQNWRAFSRLLLETGDRPIVEQSRKDEFWGAKPTDERTLVGLNVLGRLLMELREAVKVESRESLLRVQPPSIPEFLLGGRPIGIVAAEDAELDEVVVQAPALPSRRHVDGPAVIQPSLFDEPAVKEATLPMYPDVSKSVARIVDLKPYLEYKPSSQAWLGEIPQHWSVLPNRALFAEVKERNHPDEEMLSVTITKGIVRQKALLEGGSKKDSSNLDKSAYKLVLPSDIAYNKMRAWQGAIGASALRGIISPAYVVMRLRKEDNLPSYYHHLYRTPQFAKEAERFSYGITSDMWSLRPEHFKMIYAPKPPPDEQAAIVRFLDWANRRLERAIRAKRKVIALLNEQKQAIIHRTVTRGLDPSVSLKHSGIPWLGDIPEHWEVKLLHHLLNPTIPLAYGILLPGPRLDDGIPYIGAGDVRPDRLRLDILPRTTPEIAAAYPRTQMRAGELVYAIRGSFGNVEVIPPRLDGVNLSRDAARLAPRGDIEAFWLTYLLRSRFCQEQFKLKEVGATITGVNIRDLKRIILPVPPREEQAMLAAFLDQETCKIDSVMRREEREVTLLREYRTRLVADVVTGKLDVREAAARLPDEALPNSGEDDTVLGEETEPADDEVAI